MVGNAVRIVHISDLHFGMKGQADVWGLLAQEIRRIEPHLMLVTGDVVDTPRKELYEEAEAALRSLRVDYYVCPGNHDRHVLGNREFGFLGWFRRGSRARDVAAHFDRVFGSRIARAHEARRIAVSSEQAIGIVGVDSSIDADFLARGYVDPVSFGDIRGAVRAPKLDIVIALTHHHLLPIRHLEESRRGSRTDLAQVTCMVNAGSCLEALATSGVNLVLHGHEHSANWAGYFPLEGWQNRLAVIGAGSGTGAVTSRGCVRTAATFNLLEASLGSGVMLTVREFDGSAWVSRLHTRALSASSVRAAQQMRDVADQAPLDTDSRSVRRPGEGELLSEVTKYVAINEYRDTRVETSYKRWWFPTTAEQMSLEVENSSGMLESAELVFRADGRPEVTCSGTPKRNSRNGQEWQVEIDVPEDVRNRSVDWAFRYVLRHGALLTAEDVGSLAASEASVGFLRDEGLEYTAVMGQAGLSAIRIQLTLPEQFDPAETEGRAYRRTDGRLERAAETSRTDLRVRKVSPGHYTLEVENPRPAFLYALVWRPRPREFSELATEFLEVDSKRGARLLRTFCAALPPIEGVFQVALYCSRRGKQGFRLGASLLRGSSEEPDAEAEVHAPGDRHLVGRAGWGIAAKLSRTDQRYVTALPIGPICESGEPWGVVFVQARNDMSDKAMRTVSPRAWAAGVACVLREFLSGR